jgi:hypothetical protein
MFARESWVRVAAGFLAISYAIGAPLTAFLEYRSQTMSQRFDYTTVQVWFGLQSRTQDAGSDDKNAA